MVTRYSNRLADVIVLFLAVATCGYLGSCCEAQDGTDTGKAANGPIKVFILVGDENVLEQAPVGSPEGEERPGTLEDIVQRMPRFAFLKDKNGQWITRNDVLLYDAHPIHNNTEAPARPLKVGAMGLTGPDRTNWRQWIHTPCPDGRRCIEAFRPA